MRDPLIFFQNHLEGRSLFKKNERILIACSGGPDSVALLHFLRALAPKHGWKLGILHYDHRLRAASKIDARFVRDLAERSGLKFYGGSGDVRREATKTKTSIEEAARAMRYDFFLRTAKRLKVRKVALAHTMDDQAETVLMRVLQGTGIRGLQGIRETNRIRGVSFIRPLLAFPKKDLLEFLRASKLVYRKDKSNDSTQFLRNRIRLQLIPVLQRDYNPRVVEALSRIPAIAAGESSLVAGLEEAAWKKTFKEMKGAKVALRRSVFLQYPPALQFRLVEKALKKLDRASGLSFEAWERLRKGLGKARYCHSLPCDIDFRLTPKAITLYKK